MKNILVIDDEPEIRNMLTQLLTRNGFKVFVAADGSEGVSVCARETIALVITDLIMPGQEGVETIMQLRSDYPEIPIIAISGGGRISGTRDFLSTAKVLGASRTFAKPFDPAQILVAISELTAP